jgi:pimeloyl-ACP methyl ester carboxylesterase
VIVDVNGAELCAETFGDRSAAAILLIGGSGSPMDWWLPEFCERLAAGPRFVIRYDLRDTGGSRTDPPGRPAYGFPDLALDAAGLIEELVGGPAHLAGISMGGSIAMNVTLDRPDLVRTLTLLSTSSVGPGPDNGMPAMAPRLLEHFQNPEPEPDWTDRAAVVEYSLAELRAYAGPVTADENELRDRLGEIFDRTRDSESAAKNHALLEGGEQLRPRLGGIGVPTLVLHGTEDPLFPIGHGEALAHDIPGARLVALEGVGHEVPPRQTWDTVVTELLEHTA